ncbi:MAG: hypothetical protein QMC83_02205 [Thermodesulfovibrionales bacterium]|nr:hypothetical protein [Thermodesulfovibrionales bacterium]
MRKIVNIRIVILMFILFLTAEDSLAVTKYLKTKEARKEEITGFFTLVLYGGRHINDLETIAFLDKEGDQYEFEPYAPEFDYKIKRESPAEEALNEAKKFVSFHNSFWRSQLSRIIDDKGNTIGYELRPLYYPFVHGRDDVLEVYYRIKNDKVIVEIRLIPEIFNTLFSGDLPDSLGGF